MKKMILSIALIAGMFAMTNVSVANASSQPNTSIIAQQQDGYVDVQLEDLNDQVRSSINELSSEHDIKSIQYNSEKNLTKVEIVKSDQSTKTVFFKDNGEKVEKDREGIQHQQQEGLEREQGIERQEGIQQQQGIERQELERRENLERENLERENLQRENLEQENF